MKIEHMCLSCFYIDGYFYQENEIIRQNVLDGHDVFVIASTESYDKSAQRCYVAPSTYTGQEGAKVIRLPYSSWLPHAVMKKLRIHPGVYQMLDSIEPDVIMFHGLCGWELITAANYKRDNPEVLLFADSHEDSNNSGRSFISRNLLHRGYYKSIISRSYDALDGVLCISLETIDYVNKMYGIQRGALEFFPLLKHLVTQLAGTLSGGERQMLAVAMSLVARPKLIMLDEPSLGLSPIATEEVLYQIKEMNQKIGCAVLMVEENIHKALSISDRVYIFKTGRVILEESVDKFLERDQYWELY